LPSRSSFSSAGHRVPPLQAECARSSPRAPGFWKAGRACAGSGPVPTAGPGPRQKSTTTRSSPFGPGASAAAPRLSPIRCRNGPTGRSSLAARPPDGSSRASEASDHPGPPFFCRKRLQTDRRGAWRMEIHGAASGAIDGNPLELGANPSGNELEPCPFETPEPVPSLARRRIGGGGRATKKKKKYNRRPAKHHRPTRVSVHQRLRGDSWSTPRRPGAGEPYRNHSEDSLAPFFSLLRRVVPVSLELVPAA